MNSREWIALRKYAVSDTQRATWFALRKAKGSPTYAALALGVSTQAVKTCIRRVRATAARIDPALHTHSAPPTYHLRGASTLLDGEGNVVQQWVKTARDAKDPVAAYDNFRQALAEAPPTPAVPVKAPRTCDSDLLAAYIFGDPHFGMLAWAEESGKDFNLQIAERSLTRAMDLLVERAPPAGNAVIVNLGDMSHAAGSHNTTTKGTRVDVDSRWAKTQRVIVRALVHCVHRALEKHVSVSVVNVPGNHDTDVAAWFSMYLEAYFRNEPRVVVDMTPGPYKYHEFGNCLIGMTHGDGAKAADLPGVMATDCPAAWGRTTYRAWLCGDVHHDSLKEYPGATVETFATLAPKDAWTHQRGYRSRQGARMDVWHHTWGHVARHKITIEEINGAI